MSTERTVAFPIGNREFGVDGLAKRLNRLVIDSDFGGDASLAKRLCLEDTAGLPCRSLVET